MMTLNSLDWGHLYWFSKKFQLVKDLVVYGLSMHGFSPGASSKNMTGRLIGYNLSRMYPTTAGVQGLWDPENKIRSRLFSSLDFGFPNLFQISFSLGQIVEAWQQLSVLTRTGR